MKEERGCRTRHSQCSPQQLAVLCQEKHQGHSRSSHNFSCPLLPRSPFHGQGPDKASPHHFSEQSGLRCWAMVLHAAALTTPSDTPMTQTCITCISGPRPWKALTCRWEAASRRRAICGYLRRSNPSCVSGDEQRIGFCLDVFPLAIRGPAGFITAHVNFEFVPWQTFAPDPTPGPPAVQDSSVRRLQSHRRFWIADHTATCRVFFQILLCYYTYRRRSVPSGVRAWLLF